MIIYWSFQVSGTRDLDEQSALTLASSMTAQGMTAANLVNCGDTIAAHAKKETKKEREEREERERAATGETKPTVAGGGEGDEKDS